MECQKDFETLLTSPASSKIAPFILGNTREDQHWAGHHRTQWYCTYTEHSVDDRLNKSMAGQRESTSPCGLSCGVRHSRKYVEMPAWTTGSLWKNKRGLVLQYAAACEVEASVPY
jgi:hypothetical protein